MTQKIFRERAIKAHTDPDTRAPLLQTTPPSVARLLVALGAVLALSLVASAFARVQIVARGRGVVRPAQGIALVRAPSTGAVDDVEVSVGQRVDEGEVLMHLGEPVTSPVAGVVDALAVRRGDVVAMRAPLAKIVPLGGALVGYLALPSRYRSSLAVGQPVRLSFGEYPAAEMGVGEGRVARISEDVVTPELASAYLIEPPGEPSFLVEVALVSLPPGAKGGSFRNAMGFEGVVPVRTHRLLTLILKPLARLLPDEPVPLVAPPPVAPPPAASPLAARAPSSAEPRARCMKPMPADAPPPAPPLPAERCPLDPKGEPPRAPAGRVTFPDAPGSPSVESEILVSAADQERGLMYRKHMPEDHAALFVSKRPEAQEYWMRNTCISLDILYIAEDGVIAGVLENVPPMDETPRGVRCRALYVLEVNAGYARRHGVRPGQRVQIDGLAQGR